MYQFPNDQLDDDEGQEEEQEQDVDAPPPRTMPFMFSASQTKDRLTQLGVSLYEPKSNVKQRTLGEPSPFPSIARPC